MRLRTTSTTTLSWMVATIFLVVSQAFNFIQSNPALIFDPPPESVGKRQAVMIYFPGNGVPPSAYQELMLEIQRNVASHYALYGVILTYPQISGVDIPAFFGGAKLVDDAITSAKIKGPFDVFLAGHSVGGILLQEVLKNQRIPYPVKVVLHASYLFDERIRSQFYRSTLTLLGDRDGVNRLTVIPAMYRERELSQNVLVLPEINHRSFSNGTSNANVHQNDLSCSSTREEGTRIIARATASFLKMDLENLNQKETPDILVSSLNYLLPFEEALTRDKYGQTCSAAQELVMLAQPPTNHSYRITSQNYFRHELPAFLLAKPSWTKDDDIQIQSFYNEPVFNSVLRISSLPQAIDVLRCKLVKKVETMNALEPSLSCQAMNQMIFQQALSAVPTSMQERFRSSRKIAFGPDTIEPLAIKWALGKLQWKDNVITSPAHRLPSSDKVYCTLISASQAMEYIMIDSQREA